MEKRIIAPGIIVYSNIVDDPDKLITEIESYANENIITWSGASVKNGNNVEIDYKTRDTLAIGVPYKYLPPKGDSINPTTLCLSSLSRKLFDSMNEVEKDYQNIHGISLEWHDAYSILKYGVGQKFTNHIDDHKDYIRRMSCVLYLNDNYTGGETTFPTFDISYKPNKNELLCFPSGYIYNHSVVPVIEGTRYAVVSWLR